MVRHAQAARCWLTISTGAERRHRRRRRRHRRRRPRPRRRGLDGDARARRRARRHGADHGTRSRTAPTSTSACRWSCRDRPRRAPVRVAIVDDHPMFRLGLAAAIEEMDGIELVGEAQRADQVAGARRASPRRRWCCSTSACPTRPGWRSTAGWPSTTRTVRVVMLTMSEDLDGVAHRPARRRPRLPRQGCRRRADRARAARRRRRRGGRRPFARPADDRADPGPPGGARPARSPS